MRWIALAVSLGAALEALGCAGTPERSSVPSQPAVSSPATSSSSLASVRSVPVDTPREPVTELLHGVRVDDPYRWLEDGASERVHTWTREQNAYTRLVLDRLPARGEVRSSIEKFVAVGSVGAPVVRRTSRGGWRYFYLKRTAQQNQPVLWMRDGLAGRDKSVVDVNALAADGTVALDWFFPSGDGRLVAFGTSHNGDENSRLRVRDVSGPEHRDLSDEIGEVMHCSLAWKPDGTGFFYTRLPKKGTVPDGEEHYHRGVFEHQLGTDSSQDPKVFGDGRPMTDSPGVELSPNGRWLVLEVYQGWSKNELYLIDLRAAKRTVVPVVVGKDALYGTIALDDRILVQTDEGAPKGRLMVLDPRAPSREKWRELVPESADAMDRFVVTRRELIVSYQHDAASRLERFDLGGKSKGAITLPSIGTATLSAASTSSEAFVGFHSFAVPSDVFHVPLGATAEMARWQAVESPLAAEAYEVAQHRVRSKDGVEIPYFVVRRSDVAQDGTAAALLTGYGGFNIAENPRFVGAAGVLLEHGGVYVLANLRGGSEYGETWHRAGMLEHKQNVFDDMVAVALDVVDRKIASKDRLGVIGGSNGGLLASAMVVQQPSLFRVAVARVPLTDMLRYQNFLLAKFWVPEYGSADDETMFPALLAYSPYHHVKRGEPYPAVLLTAGESDGRVDPMHARKMAAALQWATSSSAPVLLRVETKAGHGAGKPVSKQVDEFTDVYSFVMSELGILSGEGKK